MKLKLLPFIPLLFLAASPVLAGTPIDKTITAQPDGNVHISNVSGSVGITTWNRDKIHVGGTLGDGAKRLEVKTTSGGVNIRVVLPQHCNCEGSRLVIQLPEASHLRANTVSANITAGGLAGPVRLKSVSGEINLKSRSGDINAKSVSGDVKIEGSAAHASIEAQSISGGIDIEHIRGKLRAESVSGSIEIDDNNTLSGGQFNTTSGGIEFEGELAGNGDYEFHSVSGDIKLELPGTPAARFNASSLSGNIHANFGPKPRRTSEYGPGKAWHYTSGEGDAQVSLRTMSGDIRIHASGS